MGNDLELKFKQELLANFKKMEIELKIINKRFLLNVEKFGAVKTVENILKKADQSDEIEKLANAKKIEYSIEATVVKSVYASLFSDDLVNKCYTTLCDYSYFG